MKTSLYSLMLTLLTCLATITSNAGSFITVTSGDWNTLSTWSYSGDADGVPDADDNVTILGGHVVTITSLTNNSCQNLTVHDTLLINSNMGLLVYGDYTVNGAEQGMGTITFMPGSGTYINGGGDFGNMVKYVFETGSNRLIQAGTVIKKNFDVVINSTTVTNYGDLTVKDVIAAPTASFINETGAVLTLLQPNFMLGATFMATSANNTVIMRTGGDLPLTVGSTYSNLVIVDNVTNVVLTSPTTVQEDIMFIGTGSLNQNEFDLTVSGNFFQYDTGELIHVDKEYLILDGYVLPQTIDATNLHLRQLKIKNANGVTHASGNITLASVLTLETGDLTISAVASFTMLSTANETARIDEITSGSVIIGEMNMQRYITGQTEGRDTSWIDLSSSVSTGTVAQWDGELYFNYVSGANANARVFNEPSDNWNDITSAGTSLLPGEGYEIFLADNATMQNWSGTTLTTTGVPNVGDQDLSARLSYTPGNTNFNLVGNPFQSSVYWATILTASSDIASTYWYYDHVAGTYTVGGMFDEIPTGQGFWLLSTGPNPQLIVPEAAKTPASNSTVKSSQQSFPYMLLTLTSVANGYNQKVYVGQSAGATTNFELSTDHPFHRSPNRAAPVMYCTTMDGKKAVINAFGTEVLEITIPLTIEAGTTGTYTLSAGQIEYVDGFSCVVLHDELTGINYDLRTQSEITLELTAGSNYANRFTLRMGLNCDADAVTETSNVEFINKQQYAQVNFHYASEQQVTVNVTNLVGQTIVTPMNVVAGENSVNINIPADYHGMYLVSVTNGNEIKTGKLVKE